MKEAIPFDMYETGTLDPQDAAPVKVAGGRYSLRRMLGRGGMGMVWLAFDERLQGEVALKFLPPEIRFDTAALDELRRETARSQKLTHPNIVRIHDLYEAENQDAFISMEYVDGPDLGTLRAQQTGKTLSWSYLAPLLPQLCEALEYAHAEGIIHRDLKPANVMVDQSGRLKLADFGIARSATDPINSTATPKASGTLLYMSPQQLEGAAPSPTDDVYGLGATLYELLTSKPPFYTGDLPHQVRNVVAMPLSERLRELKLANNIPSHVEALVLACLHKSASQRPQHPREVAEWAATRQRPQVKARRTPLAKRTLGALIVALRTHPAWCYGGASGLAAIATVLTIFGHSHGKVEARETEQPPPTPAARSAQAKLPSQNSASNPARTPVPLYITKPVDRTTNVVLAAATPPQAAESGRPESEPVSASARVPAAPVTAPPPQRTSPPVRVALASRPASPLPPPPKAVRPPPKPATALQLARQGNLHVSERSKDQVVQISSSKTPIDSAPQDWRVIYYDPKAPYDVIEVQFEGLQMARVREPTRLRNIFTPSSQRPLDFQKLIIDSDEAQRIALRIPALQAFTVRSAQLDLERGYGDLPVWRVRLYGDKGGLDPSAEGALGYAIILAEDGKVLKETFSKKTPRPK